MSTLPPLHPLRILITGASQGIGRSIAHRFAHEGAHCTLIGRHHDSLERVRAFLSCSPGPAVDVSTAATTAARDSSAGSDMHRIVVGDVGERDFWVRVVREEKEIDVLINAAGVTHYSLLMATRQELVEEVVRTNLMGTVWGCQVVGKGMARRKRGCIINVSSLLGVKGGRGSAAYAASKAGIIGLTRSLAAEMGPINVRVNAIVPGYIETQMTDAMTPEARSQALDQIPLKRFGKVEEVADAAVFLARNAYANNCVLNLDGGLSAT